MREVARELDVSKTNVRRILQENGVALRPTNGAEPIDLPQTEKFHVGVAPYGYVILYGKLVEDPKEQRSVQLVLKLRQKGLSFPAIAKELDRRKVKSRTGRPWDHTSVRSIVIRNQNK